MRVEQSIRTEEEILATFIFNEEILLELVSKINYRLENAISKRKEYIYISIHDYLIKGYDYSYSLLKILSEKNYKYNDRRNGILPVIKVLLTRPKIFSEKY